MGRNGDQTCADLVQNGAELDARPPGKSPSTVPPERGAPGATVGWLKRRRMAHLDGVSALLTWHALRHASCAYLLAHTPTTAGQAILHRAMGAGYTTMYMYTI